LPASAQTFLFWRSPFAYLQHCRDRYGPTFTLNASSFAPLIFLSDPDDIRVTMATSEEVLRPGEGGGAVQPIVGARSFMLSDGHEHRVGRKATLAAFHASAIKHHVETIVELVEQALARWPTDVEVALHPCLRLLTLELVLRTLVGRGASVPDERTVALHGLVLDMLEVTASPVFIEPHLRHGPGRRTWQSFLRHRVEVDRLLYAMIEQHETSSGLLGILSSLTDSEGLRSSNTQIRDNAMSLILAGHETTAAQLAWAFQLLAHNPAVCKRLQAEIDEGRSEAYLTATIHEVLRHRCVFVFAIPRAVAKPVNIGSYVHGPPVQLLACIYLLHHDPTIYRDPDAFRPERFLDAPPNPRVWIPWGGGRKRCPGLHLAMLEMKTVLRTVLASRTVHPAAERMERPCWRSVIVTPHAGSTVILKPR
jgi:cytochrome P450